MDTTAASRVACSFSDSAAAADIEADRYGLACVVGLEQMRHVPGEQAAAHLGAAQRDKGLVFVDLSGVISNMDLMRFDLRLKLCSAGG